MTPLQTELQKWLTNGRARARALTCRTLLAGYKVKYDVSVNCGEEAPDKLKLYYRQRYRWIRGHAICGLKYTRGFITSKYLSLREKIEGVLWININCIPVFIMMSLAAWLLHIFVQHASFMMPSPISYLYLFFTLMGLVSMTMAGLQKAHQLRYLKYVVLMIINAYPMCFAVSLKAYIDIITNKPLKWTKTERNGIMT